jgi:hypothetical protein
VFHLSKNDSSVIFDEENPVTPPRLIAIPVYVLAPSKVLKDKDSEELEVTVPSYERTL